MEELRQKDDATMGEKLKFLRQAAEAHRQVHMRVCVFLSVCLH